MICPNCGEKNIEGLRSCAFCHAEFSQVKPPKTDGYAIASLILGAAGILTCGLTALVGLVLGIVSLVRIGRKPGVLTGQGLAIAGLAVSGVMIFFIPIMAAILFPVFATAREKARQTACLSNMRSISTALIIYSYDYDEYLPPAETWADAIEPYLANPAVLQCPVSDQTQESYAFNAALGGMNLFSIPDNAVLIFESDLGHNAHGGIVSLPTDPRHMEFDNYGLAEGSAKAVRREKAGELIWTVDIFEVEIESAE